MGLSPAAAKARRARSRRPSTVDKLDAEVRELIAQLRIDRGWTIDEIRNKLGEIGQGHISRSALGRHVRTIEEVSADLRETQIYAEALAKEAGSKNGDQLLDMNAQLLQAHMFKLMLAAKDGSGVMLDPKSVKEFSEALRNIGLTRKTALEVVERAEKRATEKATKAAAEKAVTAARSKGLSKDTVEAIRFAVLGSDG